MSTVEYIRPGIYSLHPEDKRLAGRAHAALREAYSLIRRTNLPERQELEESCQLMISALYMNANRRDAR